jgi:hypothetical protein
MDVNLVQRWKATEAVLERARAALPQPTDELRAEFYRAVDEYRHFLDHNELGLAFEALRDAAKLVPSRGGVWKDLIRAAGPPSPSEQTGTFASCDPRESQTPQLEGARFRPDCSSLRHDHFVSPAGPDIGATETAGRFRRSLPSGARGAIFDGCTLQAALMILSA